MLITIIAIIVILLLGFILVRILGGKKNEVVKSEIFDFELLEEKASSQAHLYRVFIDAKKKPVDMLIPKHFDLEKGQIITYKMMRGEPRFILLEHKIEN